MNFRTILAAGSLVAIGVIGCWPQDDRNRQNQAGRDAYRSSDRTTAGSTGAARDSSTADSGLIGTSQQKHLSYDVQKIDKASNQVTLMQKKAAGSDVALQSGDEPLVITFVEFDRLADAGKGMMSGTTTSAIKASSQLKEGQTLQVKPAAGKSSLKSAADIEHIMIEIEAVPVAPK